MFFYVPWRKYRKLKFPKDTNSKKQKILIVSIDNKLVFSSYIRELCKKASQKYRLYQEYQTNLMLLKKTPSFSRCSKTSVSLLPSCLDVLFKNI